VKKLYLLRHAKSSWDDQSLDDFERPLNKRGEKAAPVIGQEMKERGLAPDLIVCSPAMRTRQTAELALKSANISTEVKFEEDLYLASEKRLRSIVSSLDDKLGSVLLIGHNPGLEQLVGSLSGHHKEMKTAALAAISLEIDSWKKVAQGSGRLEYLVTAKELSED
jgi:phosphohistidine phosphatase